MNTNQSPNLNSFSKLQDIGEKSRVMETLRRVADREGQTEAATSRHGVDDVTATSSRTDRRRASTAGGHRQRRRWWRWWWRWWAVVRLYVIQTVAQRADERVRCIRPHQLQQLSKQTRSTTSALEVDNFMRYINLLTYLLTYLLTSSVVCDISTMCSKVFFLLFFLSYVIYVYVYYLLPISVNKVSM